MDLPKRRGRRTIHEPQSVPNEWDPTQTDVLTEGLVITIEPMLALGSGRPVEDADGWTIRTRDRGLAAHYEDTLVITRGRPVVLTGTAVSRGGGAAAAASPTRASEPGHR